MGAAASCPQSKGAAANQKMRAKAREWRRFIATADRDRAARDGSAHCFGRSTGFAIRTRGQLHPATKGDGRIPAFALNEREQMPVFPKFPLFSYTRRVLIFP